MVRNFRFEEDRVALSAFPETPAAVDWLYDQGIRTVVSLHPVPPDAAARLRERGMEWRPFLIEDFTEGVPAGFREMLEFLGRRSEEQPTLLHCQGGGGRAGTVYGAYLVSQGVPVENVLVRVPGIKEVGRAFLRGFAAGLVAKPDR